MLGKIIAVLLAAGGLPGLIWPGFLQWQLRRKGMRHVTRLLFIGLLFTGGLLISYGWQMEGWIPKAISIAGCILLLKSLMLFRARIGLLIAEKLMLVPPLGLRILALCQIAVGAGLYFLSRSS